MGRGIAQVSAASGYETVVREVNDELLQTGLGAIGKQLNRAVEKGKLEAAECEATLGRLIGTVALEDLEFRDQVALFRDAETVVAPHGGGLTNLVFCDPGTKVIELFPAANIDLYYRLAVVPVEVFGVPAEQGTELHSALEREIEGSDQGAFSLFAPAYLLIGPRRQGVQLGGKQPAI